MKDLVRRINFFTASFLGILGISLIGEIFGEDDPPDKIDDILFLVLGMAAIYWYKKTGHNASKSVMSIALIAIGIIIKIFAIFVEHADKEAVGDDYGILSGLVVAFIFVIWQTLKSKES